MDGDGGVNAHWSHGGKTKQKCLGGHTVVLGNIFDDLKAMQTDLTEFEIDGGRNEDPLYVAIDGKDIEFKQANDYTYCEVKQFSAFILKLRQMEMTLKRSK